MVTVRTVIELEFRMHTNWECIGYASRSESSSGSVFWHTTAFTVQHQRICWQSASDIRRCCSSPSALCRLPDFAGEVNPSINSPWPRISCGYSAGVEQSASKDQGRLLATDVSAGDQVSSLPSVIWLTEIWRCTCWLIVKLSVRDVQYFLLSALATASDDVT